MKELSELTDQELLEKAKKMKSTNIINAALIGFMFGVLIYSIIKDNVSVATFTPLVLILIVINNSKKNKEVEKLLEERKLK